MLDILNDFGRSLRIADIADILVVAALLYCGLVWLQRTASRSVFFGVFVLAVLYVIADTFEMYMTKLIFNATVFVLAIALVIVFQQDLRRGLERIVMLGTLPTKPAGANWAADVDALTEIAFALASEKIGALIVLGGNSPIVPYIDGGIPISAGISRPLLHSIFDPHSPGHDGAVIVQQGRVVRFATRLPLSKNLREIGTLGTRHTAALGMSECLDVLVIAVSEERGVVSVAQQGRLTQVEGPGDLKVLLDEFLSRMAPPSFESKWKRIVTRHTRTKALALMLAVAGWFALAYRTETVHRVFIVPVEYVNVPKNVQMNDTVPNDARVTFAGSSQSFRFLVPSNLKVSIDLTEARNGKDAFTVTERNVRHPQNVTVYGIEPRLIRVPLAGKTSNHNGAAGTD